MASGTLIVYINELVEFDIENNKRYSTKLMFVNDSKFTGTDVKAEPYQDKSVIIRFVNYDDPLGISNVTPIVLGVLDGRTVYFDFVVYSLGTIKKKVLHYTFKLGEKIQ